RLNLDMSVAALDQHLAAFTYTRPEHRVLHRDTKARLATSHDHAFLGRKDIDTVSYVLASVLDDADQGITDVIRGADLYDITFLQVLLQRLLGLPTPVYHHHRLIRDEDGRRLAKRDEARALRTYRAEGATPDDIRRMVGLA